MGSSAKFVHLHNHSQYSILDGLSTLDGMVKRAAELGQDAIALTDHGVLYGAVEFFEVAKKAGVKPIVGMEGYMALKSRTFKGESESSPYHLTLLAKNLEGYENLNRLSSLSHLEGFYKKPRFDWEDLKKYSKGLIVLSGCPSSEIMHHLLRGDKKGAKKVALKFKELFSENYFFEVMRHTGIDGQEKANQILFELAKELDVLLVATNDSHYVEKGEAKVHEALLCIQTNAKLDDPNRFKFSSEEFYLRSAEEMLKLFSDVPEAVSNTVKVADMVDLRLELGSSLTPRYPTPQNESSIDFLRRLCVEGSMERFNGSPDTAVKERLEYELSVIEDTNYADYFLVCWDIFNNFVNKKGILSAVRGSAAASMVLYCLKVTHINPLTYTLVFERFLNRERREMPDIDMDFADERREEVIEYCVKKYGKEHVAQIITFGTLGSRTALRDVARISNQSILGDKLARLLAGRYNITVEEAIKTIPEFRELYEKDVTSRGIIELASKVEGTVRHASTHAAGVVISHTKLTDHIALQRSVTKDTATDTPTTQCSMDGVAKVGLLKMDFLGLRNLSVIARTIDAINRSSNAKKIDVYDLPLDDHKTYEILSRGDTFGVFQLEGEGMTANIRKLKPNSIGDIAAMIALYRPGPMEHIDEFIRAKHGQREASYPHQNLRHILEETYGVIVYQDQILLIAQEFGGYSLGEADKLRKAMGKKIPEVMEAEHERFLDGAVKNGYERRLAEQIFSLIKPFAGYAFNKAHSVSYALISYWTAYLKVNHKLEYFANLLDSQSDDQARVAANIESARLSGIKVKAPSLNRSMVGFSVSESGDALRVGLANIKGVGRGNAQSLVELRKNKPFVSLDDFCRRVTSSQISRSTLETLTKAGAMDEFGSRKSILGKVDLLTSFIQTHTKMRQNGQSSMFNLFGEEVNVPMPSIDVEKDKDDLDQIFEWEIESLGIPLSGAPSSSNGSYKTSLVADFVNVVEGSTKTIYGRVSGASRKTSKNGNMYLKCKLALADGSLDLVLWEEALKKMGTLFENGNHLEVVGQVKYWREEPSLTVSSAKLAVSGGGTNTKEEGVLERSMFSEKPVQPAYSQGGTDRLVVKLIESLDKSRDVSKLDDVLSVLWDHKGDSEIFLEVSSNGDTYRLALSDKVKIDTNLKDELLGIVGEDGLEVV